MARILTVSLLTMASTATIGSFSARGAEHGDGWKTPSEDVAFSKLPSDVRMVREGFLWIEAEDFKDYGEWRLDTQFVHLMGSAYLIAGGIGKPIRDAATEVNVSTAGRHRLWVRAKNWLKDPSPGRFTVSVNGVRSGKVLGAAETQAWIWQSAGEFDLPSGATRITLHDLTGYFARCDSLLLTTDLAYTPPNEPNDLSRERARLSGRSLEVRDEGAFDVIVVGGGTAGCCAAIASARLGGKTALIQNRPVLGGNASIELGVGVAGASARHRNARETGIIEEVNQIKRRHGHRSVSEAFRMLTEAERGLTVFYNRHAVGVEKDSGGLITAVKAIDTLTGLYSRYRGRLFIDCTGDGWVGYYAGAKYRMGRESREEFGEDLAPSLADAITMSGCLMDNLSVGFRAEDTGKPVKYVPPPWAAKLPSGEAFGRAIRRLNTGEWWLEHPGDIDDLYDAERARDELIRITFGYWNHIKNDWAGREQAANWDLVYVPHMDAKRETRRLIGDYILKQQDVQRAVPFSDRISYGGWSIDVHHPRGVFSGKEGPYDCDPHVPIYSIPYRCLYSVNIENLLFAGRDISVTHIALGTVRVMGTLATLGQAAGTAAALCLRHNVSPRRLGQEHIVELQQMLLKNDQYIPELKNEDPADLARRATVTASSTAGVDEFTRDRVQPAERHELNMPRAVMFPRGLHRDIKSIDLLLHSELDEPVELTLHLRSAPAKGDFSCTQDLAAGRATLAPQQRAWVRFPINGVIDQPYLWVWLPKTPGVSWYLTSAAPNDTCRAYGGGGGRNWTVVNQSYAFCVDPPLAFQTDIRPENVINGVTRTVDATSNLWASDPNQPMPQWIELTFDSPVNLNTVYLTFDTDLDSRFGGSALSPRCVRDYALTAFDGAQWREVAKVTDNYQRRRAHMCGAASLTKLRLTVQATHGDRSARVFEVRAYME
jgi:hypothetical protein